MEALITATLAFWATDIDDLLLLSVLFAAEKRKGQMILGKYLGLGALILLSILGARGVQVLPGQYVRLLGLLPIAIALKEILGKQEEDTLRTMRSPLWSVALITLAGGGDNIAVYIPLFGGQSTPDMCLMLLAFALMNGILCLLAMALANLPAPKKFIQKYKGIITPTLLILLGLYILFF